LAQAVLGGLTSVFDGLKIPSSCLATPLAEWENKRKKRGLITCAPKFVFAVTPVYGPTAGNIQRDS